MALSLSSNPAALIHASNQVFQFQVAVDCSAQSVMNPGSNIKFEGSRFTEDDLSRFCQHLGIAAPAGIDACLGALCQHLVPTPMGPVEAVFWKQQFYKVPVGSTDLLKDLSQRPLAH